MAKKSLILLCAVLILLISNAFATVALERALLISTGSDNVLGAPRKDVCPFSAAGKVGVFFDKSVNGQPFFYISNDFGATWASYINISNRDSLNYHAHLISRNDTFWISQNDPGTTDDWLISGYDISPTPTRIMEVRKDTTVSGTTYDSYIGSVAYWQNAGPGMVAVARGSGAYTQSGVYMTSADNGVTWTWATSRVFTTTVDCRIGILPSGGDSAIFVRYYFGSGYQGIQCRAYSATGWNDVGASGQVAYGNLGFTRDVSFDVDMQGTIHILVSDTLSPSHITHYFKRTTDPTWQSDIVHTSTRKEGGWDYDGNRGLRTCFVVTMTGKLWLVYTSSYEEASTDARRVYVKEWNSTTSTWGTEYKIGATYNQVFELSGCGHVPTSHETRGYFIVQNHSNSSSGSSYLLTLHDAAADIEATAQVKVTSIPWTVTAANHSAAYNAGTKQRDTIALIGTRLNSSDSGLMIQATKEWDLIGQGDTIVYNYNRDASNTIDYSYGLKIGTGTGSDSIRIYDLTIIEGTIGIDTNTFYATDSEVQHSRALAVTGQCDNVQIYNCYLHAKSYNGHPVQWDGPRMGYMENCVIRNDCSAFRSRGNYDGAAFYSQSASTSDLIPTDSFNFKAVHCRITRTPHQGFSLTTGGDSAIFKLLNCYVLVDAENLRWTAYAGSERGKANCYGIQYTAADNGSYIKKCTVLAGENNTGGRGIQLVADNGWNTTTPMYGGVVVCSNYVNVHEGADVEFPSIASQYFPCGIKVRQNNQGVDVFDNTVIYVSDGSASWTPTFGANGQTGAYYREGEAAMYHQWMSTDLTPAMVRWWGNRFITYDRATGAFNSAFAFEDIKFVDHSLKFFDNYLESDSALIRIGGGNTAENTYVDSIYACTLKTTNTVANRTVAYIHSPMNMDGGLPNDATNGFTVRDMVYKDANGNPIDLDTSIVFGATSYLQDQKNLMTMEVTVVDSTSTPIQNASVLITNNYFTALFNGLTNSLGKASKIVTYWFESRTEPDSMAFNDFQVSVSYGGISADSTFTVGWNNKDFTVMLGTAEQPVVRKHFHGWKK